MPRWHNPGGPRKTAGARRGGPGGRYPRMGKANEVSRKDPTGNPDKGRGKQARGPVAVVVATLAELGWEEDGPHI
eukprot:11205840-Heterocapsa_arctica.AAC.1